MDPNQLPEQNQASQQPAQNQPSPGQYDPNNPYGFITDAKPAKKPLFDHTSTKSRIILVVAGIFLLFIIAGVASSILSRGKRAYVTSLKGIYAEQQEVIRVSEMGVKDALSQTTRNYAETINLSVKTQQQQVLTILGKNDAKVEPVEANAKKSTKTDDALKAAQAANRYDDVMIETLNSQLESYRSALDKSYNATESASAKKEFEKMYSETLVLIGKPAATD